jgi:hypothetical protein
MAEHNRLEPYTMKIAAILPLAEDRCYSFPAVCCIRPQPSIAPSRIAGTARPAHLSHIYTLAPEITGKIHPQKLE